MSFAPVVFIPWIQSAFGELLFGRQPHQAADCGKNGTMPFVQDKEILRNPAGKAERCCYQSQFYQAVNPNVTGKNPQQNASNDQDCGLGSCSFEETSELQIQGAAQRLDLPGQHQKAPDR